MNLGLSILDQIHCSLDDIYPETEFKIALPDDMISKRSYESICIESSEENEDVNSLRSTQTSQDNSFIEETSQLEAAFDMKISSSKSKVNSVLSAECNHALQDDDKISDSITQCNRRKRKARLRQKLVKMNLFRENQVIPVTDADEIEKLEELVNVKPNGPIYYCIENGFLGKGGYGSVQKGYAIKGKEKIPVALKFLKYSGVHEFFEDKDLGFVPAEVCLLKQMKNHKNVINFLHYQKESAEKFMVITERSENCQDLYGLQKKKRYPLTEEESRKIVKKLVNVLRKMEKKGIAHRDVKIENIIYDLDKDDIKLIDFGLATKFKQGELFDEFYGTTINVPPEFLLNNEYDVCKETVRSVGNVLFYLLHGFYPYKQMDERKTRLPHLGKRLSFEAQDIISGMYAIDPKERLTLKEVSKHPWMKSQKQRTPIRARISSFFRGLFRRRSGSYTVNREP